MVRGVEKNLRLSPSTFVIYQHDHVLLLSLYWKKFRRAPLKDGRWSHGHSDFKAGIYNLDVHSSLRSMRTVYDACGPYKA